MAGEDTRVAALNRYAILDTPSESCFDDLTRLAAQICETPVALIYFHGSDRLRFKSCVGLELDEIPANDLFGGGISEMTATVVIPDTTLEDRICRNPLVTGEPFIRFYAGVPLISPDGFALGALYVIDRRSRQITTAQLAAMKVLADQVIVRLELRRMTAEAQARQGALLEQEELLRLNEKRFELAAKVTNDAIWDWDIVRNHLWVSEGFHRLVGRSPRADERAIDLWTELVHPDDREALSLHWETVINSPETVTADQYRLRRIDGSHIEVIDRAVVIRDCQGKAVRAVGGITDLSERTVAEEKLREQAALLDQASDGIMVHDLQHNVLYWSKGAERIYGWHADELKGRNLCDFLCSDPQQVAAAVEAVLLRGQWSGEMRHRTKNRREITAESRWSLLFSEDGKPKSIMTINTDITEKKLIQTQFLRAQRLESIGTLAGGIAHDLNNVLAPISMAVEILKMEVNSPGGRETLELVEQSARRGADMVRQVLGFARGVEGKRTIVQPKHLVRDVEKIIKETFPRNIHLKSGSSTDTWPVHADVTQLHQVLLNLCVNARDAMRGGGDLHLSCENLMLDQHYASMQPDAQPGPYVVLRVTDTGTGMADEVRDRIFEPFFTTKQQGEGTGLGLPTVLAVVKGHGGFITVYTEWGKGSTFKVYLPAAPDEKETRTDEAVELPRGNGELILVVDDEDSIRTITRQTLEAFGYRAITATDGADALAAYARRGEQIHLVITDIMMPIMDGPNTILALMRMNPSVKIIAASGLSANGGVAKATGAGVKHFLAKPYTADKLLQTVRDALAAPGIARP